MSKQVTNPASLATLFLRELTLCRVKEGETVAFLSDTTTSREYALALGAAEERRPHPLHHREPRSARAPHLAAGIEGGGEVRRRAICRREVRARDE